MNDMKSLKLAHWMLVLLLHLAGLVYGKHAACSVSMNGGLPDPQPLILTPGGSFDALGFKLPFPSGELNFTSGEQVRLVCAGANNVFKNLGSGRRDIVVRCDRGAYFTYNGERRKFNSFSCSEVPKSTTRHTQSRCNNNKNSVLEIGFMVTAREFFKVIDVCFDEQKLNNIWSMSYVLSVVKGSEAGFTTADAPFTSYHFYSGVDPENLYSKRTQKINIKKIIGPNLGNHYINSSYYLTRGLLSNGENFVYKSQQLAALNFVNVAPQWQNLKAGMWRIVEKRIRDYANVRGVNLVVYSGTHSVTTLTDVSKEQREQELYLLPIPNTSKKIAVPAIFWKVVYDPISKKGVALVAINNPHKNSTALEMEHKRYTVCATKRYISCWHICASSNQEVGLGYCCTVDDFRNFVTSLPQFEVIDILT